MRCFPLTVAILLLLLPSSMAHAEEPVFDAIDYSSPDSCLGVAECLGDREAIDEIASGLKADQDRQTLSNTLRWMQSNLKCDPDLAYEWRNFDSVNGDKCYGGCADYANACGALLQSSGIPTVWVKTMDIDWIRKFKKQGPPDVWSGHVFLEVYLDGKWVLLDPGASTIYENYSTDARILPGNRFAYHKGCDPKQMVMSLQWDDWKDQTTKYFTELDPGMLPVDTTSAVSVRDRCHMIANSPYYQLFGALLRQQGKVEGTSFNHKFDGIFPKSKGRRY